MFEFQNTLHKNIFEFTVNTDFETISYFTRQPSSAMENSPPDLCDGCTGIISILGIHMCEVGPFLSLSIVASRIILVVLIKPKSFSSEIR